MAAMARITRNVPYRTLAEESAGFHSTSDGTTVEAILRSSRRDPLQGVLVDRFSELAGRTKGGGAALLVHYCEITGISASSDPGAAQPTLTTRRGPASSRLG
jgi:hypothetical protein